MLSRQDMEEGIYEATLGKTKTVSPMDFELAEPSRNTTLPKFNQTI